jgi:hypothetical protein
MGVLAHGGTLGLIVELGPAVILAGLGVAMWLRGRRRLPAGDEARVEERSRDGE